MSILSVEQRAGFPGRPAPDQWLRWANACASPGPIIAFLRDTGHIRSYPELAAIVGVEQDPEWHPEGPVHIHTDFVVGAAAEIADREGLEPVERAVLLFSALTHDLGKATTTRLRLKDGRKRWTSYGHEQESGPLARRFLTRIGIERDLIDQVIPLVENHMCFRVFGDEKVEGRAVRKLARRLGPASIRQLAYLIEADHSGRPPLPKHLPEAAKRMVEVARDYGVLGSG